MKDLALTSHLQHFAKTCGIEEQSEDKQFEAFVASMLFQKYHRQPNTCHILDHLTGGDSDAGIDALGLFVNRLPIHTPDDIMFHFGYDQTIKAELVLIQAKTSTSFNTKDIGQFTHGASQFCNAVLGNHTTLPFNVTIDTAFQLFRYLIQEHGSQMDDDPTLHLYFATAGRWQRQLEPEGRLRHAERELQDSGLFSSVRVHPIDAQNLKVIWREINRTKETTISIEEAGPFPAVPPSVDQAFIGFVPGSDFIQLLQTPDEHLDTQLFAENVRAFLGPDNPVNAEIQKTIATREGRLEFPLLNNGVTIVATDVKRRLNEFTVSNYQVVNGAQTSHVLFNNRDKIDDALYVPIKLLVTDNPKLIPEIVSATNRQTIIHPEQLQVLTPFQKDLEDVYSGSERQVNPTERVYYERRRGQHDANSDVLPDNIVTFEDQIRSYLAMFLNEPHDHHRAANDLLRRYSKDIFGDDHHPHPYYASGVSLALLRSELKGAEGMPSSYDVQDYVYHALMLLRLRLKGYQEIPKANQYQIGAYSLSIIEHLRSPSRDDSIIETIKEQLARTLRGYLDHAPSADAPDRERAFTEYMLELLYPNAPLNAYRQRRGTIEEWYPSGYGYIKSPTGQMFAIDSSALAALPKALWVEGTQVTFRKSEESVAKGQYPNAVGVREMQ